MHGIHRQAFCLLDHLSVLFSGLLNNLTHQGGSRCEHFQLICHLIWPFLVILAQLLLNFDSNSFAFVYRGRFWFCLKFATPPSIGQILNFNLKFSHFYWFQASICSKNRDKFAADVFSVNLMYFDVWNLPLVFFTRCQKFSLFWSDEAKIHFLYQMSWFWPLLKAFSITKWMSMVKLFKKRWFAHIFMSKMSFQNKSPMYVLKIPSWPHLK